MFNQGVYIFKDQFPMSRLIVHHTIFMEKINALIKNYFYGMLTNN